MTFVIENILQFRISIRKEIDLCMRITSELLYLLYAGSSIPRLPIPPLEETLAKYIQTVTPLLNEEQLKNTIEIVEEFKRGDGPGIFPPLL